MPVLYLREADVEALLDMPTAIEVMAAAFLALASGEAENVPRVRAKATGIVLHSLNATAEYLGLVGWKLYTTTKHGAKFLVGLHAAKSGELRALLEADMLGQLRTGAVTGLAIRTLADPQAASLGLFGTGWQAESQLAAAIASCPIQQAYVYSRREDARRDFAQRMTERHGIEVIAVDDPRRAVEYQPLVITATSAKDPVFDGRWLTPGTLVCAIGSNWLSRAEIDVATVEAARLIVCDSIVACQSEAGDFIQPLAAGVFKWTAAVELSAIVAGQHAGKAQRQDIVLFKSVGLGIEDVALGGKAVELAQQRGIGLTLPIG